ncbi:hypothetical protein EDF44_0038 [Rathayibacter sp. PhB185]|nr:hypothetical protein EDF45_0038 [Rathayibacter sp. PhB186]ROS54903.1 hypothetical protein EDF44_0038 [Rathayibacter sp. PhB185]
MGVRAPLGALPRCCAAACESALTRCEASIRSGLRGGQGFVRALSSCGCGGSWRRFGSWNRPRHAASSRNREPEVLPRAGGRTRRTPARGISLGSSKRGGIASRSDSREPEVTPGDVRHAERPRARGNRTKRRAGADSASRRRASSRSAGTSGDSARIRHAERPSARGDARNREPDAVSRAGASPGLPGHAESPSARGNLRKRRAGADRASRRRLRSTSGSWNDLRHAETRGNDELAVISRAGGSPGLLAHAEPPSARGNPRKRRAGGDQASRRWPAATPARLITFGT